MSKITRKVVVIALVVMLFFAYAVNVNAASMSDLVEWGVVSNEEGSTTYVLNEAEDGVVKQDIVISSGENVILDLNGQTLTNYTSGCSTITVEEGATLTITGTGTITNTSSNNVPTVTNNETLNIEGGSFTSNNTGNATVVCNNATGTVNVSGGTITTTKDSCYGLTNYGTATITGGTFNQGGDFSVIMNAGKMAISGGTINVSNTTGSTSWSVITNDAENNTASLKITNVTVTGASYIIANPNNEEVVVTGGNYGTNSNIANVLDDSYTVDENGNVVAVAEVVTPDPEQPDEGDGTEETPSDDENNEATPDDEGEEATETEDETTEEATETEDETTSNPTTGDAIMVFAVVFVVALAGIIVTIKMRKRTK